MSGPTPVRVCGMDLERWTHESCEADFAVGPDWATLYSIRSKNEGKGHATQLLIVAKKHYEDKGKFVGGSVALNPRMRAIYQRLGIKEYRDETPDRVELIVMRLVDMTRQHPAQDNSRVCSRCAVRLPPAAEIAPAATPAEMIEESRLSFDVRRT